MTPVIRPGDIVARKGSPRWRGTVERVRVVVRWHGSTGSSLYSPAREVAPDELFRVDLTRCACGIEHVVRHLTPQGLQEDGAGGWLMLANCGCGSTLAVEARP